MLGGGGAEGGEDATGLSPALQVIVLGSGGGPNESNTTAFLVRSLATGWGKGSIVAVDAGVHLSAIHRILEATQPRALAEGQLKPPHTLETGPFRGLELPHATPSANASHVLRTLVDTYLITHPHLDHIAGFVINTAGLPGTRPKRLAGLPSTIAAFKAHIFNNVIWPNLTDENNGAGMVTYNRLVEGGSPALGEGEGRGYLEISDGLAVKVWGVSHGHCIERHSHRGSGSSTRYPSFDGSTIGMGGGGVGSSVGFGLGPSGLLSPRNLAHHNTASPSLSVFLQQQAAARGETSTSTPIHPGLLAAGSSAASMAAAAARNSMSMNSTQSEAVCVYDSSAYFIRDVATGREVLIFGDVEPDSISLSPRNAIIWAEAAPKIATGSLAAIFIECSYDDQQPVDRLFGHLTPRFINQEMACLAAEVAAARSALAREGRKRKRTDVPDEGDVPVGEAPGGGHGSIATGAVTETGSPAATRKKMAPRHSGGGDDPVSPKTIKPIRVSSYSEDSHFPPSVHHPLPQQHTHHHHHHHQRRHQTDSPRLATPTAELSLRDAELSSLPLASASSTTAAGGGGSVPASITDAPPPPPPLRGLKVVIIHVKDRMDDGVHAGQCIMEELWAHERESRLGCEYILSESGQDLYF